MRRTPVAHAAPALIPHRSCCVRVPTNNLLCGRTVAAAITSLAWDCGQRDTQFVSSARLRRLHKRRCNSFTFLAFTERGAHLFVARGLHTSPNTSAACSIRASIRIHRHAAHLPCTAPTHDRFHRRYTTAFFRHGTLRQDNRAARTAIYPSAFLVATRSRHYYVHAFRLNILLAVELEQAGSGVTGLHPPFSTA